MTRPAATGINRRDGFVNQMKAKHPNIQVVDVQYGAGDPLKSADIAKSMMTANPDLKGFFGANEGSIKGILNARQGDRQREQDRGRRLRLRPAADRCHQQRRRGRRDHAEPGRHRLQVRRRRGRRRSRARRCPKNIDTGFYWYDKTNIDDPEIQAVLYK